MFYLLVGLAIGSAFAPGESRLPTLIPGVARMLDDKKSELGQDRVAGGLMGLRIRLRLLPWDERSNCGAVAVPDPVPCFEARRELNR